MVVKLTKNQILFNEVKKEIESKKYKCNFTCSNGKVEKREITYCISQIQVIDNIVNFDLWSTYNYYCCYIKNNKVIIKHGVLSENYEYIKKLVENSKFNWEVLIV